jgi:hypothetical protein
VKAAQCTAVSVKRQTFLDDFGFETLGRELFLTPSPRKEPAIIFSWLNVYQPCAVQVSFRKNHVSSTFIL